MSSDDELNIKGLLPNRVYDWLKALVTIILPAVGALYLGLALLWNWPNSIGFNGTINLICAFLGSILGISNYVYKKTTGTVETGKYDGVVEVDDSGPKTIVATGFSEETLANLANKKELVLRVNTTR